MDDGTAEALRKWKVHRYRPAELPFQEAVESLGEPGALIEARLSPTRKSDWVICRAGTYSPAVFVFAAVFAEADPDYETGNLLWGKAPVPAGMDESRFIRYAGYKAAYSYAIETYHDKDFWHLMGKLDAYMETVPGFNARELPRRAWQDGTTWHGRYYLRSPMFLTCEARGGRPDPPPGLHEWVVAAHQKSKTYRANPVHPVVCAIKDGRLEKIANCTPDHLEYGDVISMVFGLTYVEDRDDWGPVPTVTHVVRVQRANREVYQLASQLRSVGIEDDVGAMPLGMVIDAEAASHAVGYITSDPDNADLTVVGQSGEDVVQGQLRATVHEGGAYTGSTLQPEVADSSTSEMDVDDDDDGSSPSAAAAEHVIVYSDGGGTSVAEDGSVRYLEPSKKRKTRAVVSSDGEGVEQSPRGGLAGPVRRRRGGRGGGK